jgi:hypothetical protein
MRIIKICAIFLNYNYYGWPYMWLKPVCVLASCFFTFLFASILFLCNVLFTLLMLSLFLKLLCCYKKFGTSNRAFIYFFNIGAFCLAVSLMSSTSFYKASSFCALLIVLNRSISKGCCYFSLLISIPMHKVKLYFDINFMKFISFLLCKHLFH